MATTEPYSMKWTTYATGADYIQIRDWTGRGFLTPAKKSGGQGKANLFSRQNLFQIKLFSILIESGLSRENASKVCKEFNSYNSKLPILSIYREGETSTVKWITKIQAADAVTARKFDSILLVNVTKIVKDIIEKLDEIKVMPARVVIK